MPSCVSRGWQGVFTAFTPLNIIKTSFNRIQILCHNRRRVRSWGCVFMLFFVVVVVVAAGCTTFKGWKREGEGRMEATEVRSQLKISKEKDDACRLGCCPCAGRQMLILHTFRRPAAPGGRSCRRFRPVVPG